MRLSAQDGTGNTGMSLATLLAQPAEVDNLDPRTLPDVLDRCSEEHVRVALVERRVCARLRSLQANQPPGDRPLLSTAAAAARLNVSRDWLYRNAPKLPFTRRVGRRAVRFDPEGLNRWVSAQRRG